MDDCGAVRCSVDNGRRAKFSRCTNGKYEEVEYEGARDLRGERNKKKIEERSVAQVASPVAISVSPTPIPMAPVIKVVPKPVPAPVIQKPVIKLVPKPAVIKPDFTKPVSTAKKTIDDDGYPRKKAGRKKKSSY